MELAASCNPRWAQPSSFGKGPGDAAETQTHRHAQVIWAPFRLEALHFPAAFHRHRDYHQNSRHHRVQPAATSSSLLNNKRGRQVETHSFVILLDNLSSTLISH